MWFPMTPAGWRRVELLDSILQTGISPIFIDADVLFFQDFFEYLSATPGVLEAHLTTQVVCGRFNASKPDWNVGVMTLRNAPETIQFVKDWCVLRVLLSSVLTASGDGGHCLSCFICWLFCRARAGKLSNYTSWDQGDFNTLWLEDHKAESLLYTRAFDYRKIYLTACGPNGPKELCFHHQCSLEEVQQFVLMHFVVGPNPMTVKVERMQRVLMTRYALTEGDLVHRLGQLAQQGWAA